MTEEPLSFEDMIDHLRRERGKCPESQALLAYESGELEPDEREKLRAHVEICGTCQASLRLIERMRQAATETEADSAGKQAIGGATDSTRREAVSKPRSGSIFAGLKEFIWRPAIAYALMLLLLYPAYRGLLVQRSKPELSETPLPSIPMGTSQTITLESSDLRGTEAKPNVLTLSSSDRFVMFEFFVPIRATATVQYAASLQGTSGSLFRVEPITSKDGKGNFNLVCPQEVLAPGSHVLAVEEFDRQKNERTATFSFSFEVAR